MSDENQRMTDQHDKDAAHLEMTAEIVSAYVSNNPVPAGELPKLIGDIHQSLAELHAGKTEASTEVLTPAVPIKRSIQDDHLVCLEDGKKFKSLKRHLATHHNLTPEEYRARWKLPADYPMVAPSYASARSQLAKKMGLGRKPTAAPESAAVPAKQARKPKTA